MLNIDAAITVRGDELKCWIPSFEDLGRDKTYFNKAECEKLAAAFLEIAGKLK